MNQLKQIKTQLKIAKKTTPWSKIQKAKQLPNYDWKFNQSEENLNKMASVLYQAQVLAKQGEQLSLVLPYCNISKIDLDLLQFSGTTNAFLAKKLGTSPLETRSSLPELVNTYGKVHIMTNDGRVLGSDLEIREVEKEVIKEVKTVQTKASGIKEKDVLKAIDNTKHTMSKVWQKDVVEAVLAHFLKEIKL
jgi:hypothetical protein